MNHPSDTSTPQAGVPVNQAGPSVNQAGEPSPFCRHLRSKKFYFQTEPPRDEEELLDASKHCWCGTTQGQVGPDNEIVDHEDCRVGRECFEGLLGLQPTRIVDLT